MNFVSLESSFNYLNFKVLIGLNFEAKKEGIIVTNVLNKKVNIVIKIPTNQSS